MATAKLYEYTCPIRGTFSSRSEEDEYVIQCLNWLIGERAVPPSHILIDTVLAKLGAQGRNSIRPDIIIFNCPAAEAKNQTGEINKDKVALLAEIKVSTKDKASALKHQLLPALEMCRNAAGGIYWDASERNFIDREGQEFSLLTLPPDFIRGRDQKSIITSDMLMPIGKGVAIWQALDQTLRNRQGFSRSQSYEDLFKLLTAKYYDETANKDSLKFRLGDDSEQQVYDKISKLYKDANYYYRLDKNLVQDKRIQLSPDTLVACVRILETYSLKNTSRDIIQEFYMKFAPQFLKQDLQQYYTPREIVAFMTENIEVEFAIQAIDPCCGTGDFMVGVLRAAKQQGHESDIADGLYCWDIDENAAKLAQINMILNGDGKTNVKVINSLDKWNKDNGYYEFVITNPPFGTKTKYEGANLKHYRLGEIGDSQTGKLFLERGLNLLRDGGYLISIIPAGYMDNPSDREFRAVILKQARAVACVNLPAGAFKEAGTGVPTSVLILQKTRQPPKDYKIFTAVAAEVGYDVTKKGAPPLFERRAADGAYLYDKNNQPKIRNDLLAIAEQFKSFAAREKLDGFRKPRQQMDYDYVSFKEIAKNGFAVNAKVHDRSTGYLDAVERIQRGEHFLLGEAAEGIEVSNTDSFKPEPSRIYKYIETGDVYRDNVKKVAELRGWELPGRARQQTAEHDILVAKMGGSNSNFLYCINQYAGAIASNGFYKVRIKDERLRWSFLRFLFTRDYEVQAKALPTGTIMSDIKEHDFLHKLYIPVLADAEIKKVKQYLDYKKRFVDMIIY